MKLNTKLIALGIVTVAAGWGFLSYRSRTTNSDPALELDNSFHPPFPSAELSVLDHDVQTRFAVVVQQDFGFSRIFQPSHALYQPATKRELADVDALKAQKLDVLFYTMGRPGHMNLPGHYGTVGTLEGPGFMTGPPNVTMYMGDFHRSFVPAQLYAEEEGPVPVQAPDAVDRKNLPELWDLTELVKPIVFPMTSWLGSGPPSSEWCALNYGGWEVVAVPVFATSQKCVDCHQAFDEGPGPIQLHSALGAAIYAYRPFDKSSAPLASPAR